MKFNASTITNGEDYKFIKLKSLKPLYMPNFRSQILFQRTISLYNNKNRPKKFDINNIITIKNYKRINNKFSSIPKKIVNEKLMSNFKTYNNINNISKITTESENSKLYLSLNKGNNLKENKSKTLLRQFSGFNIANFPFSSISDFNHQTKLLNIKNFKLSNTKYWLNESKNNSDYKKGRKDISNKKEISKFKLLNKSYKKELRVEYYKWFI